MAAPLTQGCRALVSSPRPGAPGQDFSHRSREPAKLVRQGAANLRGALTSESKRPGRGRALGVRASSAAPPATLAPAQQAQKAAPPEKPYAEGELDVPSWVGESVLSWGINLLIASPLYPIMTQRARTHFIGEAEQQGIPWREMVQALQSAQGELEAEFAALENKDIVYPDYYLKPFHAYKAGNLCWDAAYEVDPATPRLYVRTIWWAQGVLEPEHWFRQAWLGATRAHHARHAGGLPLDAVLDVGCSTGISTRLLAREFRDAQVTGLDASPYFLAVAAYRLKQMQEAHRRRAAAVTSHGAAVDAALALVPNPFTIEAARRGRAGAAGGEGGWGGGEGAPPLSEEEKEELWEEEGRMLERLRWVHGLGEATGMAAESFSLVALPFIVHECPAEVIADLVREAHRLLKPGGTLSITDNSPKSKVIQSIPKPVAALLKTTEPHSDSYYLLDLEGLLARSGYTNVTTVLSDPRHRVVTATKARSG